MDFSIVCAHDGAMTNEHSSNAIATGTGRRTPAALAERYFTAWMAHDFAAVRELLADDVSFVGALGTADGADACVAGLRGMSEVVRSIDVVRRWADEDDVITWFELHATGPSGDVTIPTVNWMHVRDGRIDRIRVTFDPRPLLG